VQSSRSEETQVTRIVIDDVQTRTALIGVLYVVLRVMDADGAFEVPQQVFSARALEEPEPALPDPGPEGVRIVDVARAPWNQPRPVPYSPCPDRGLHEQLTDCWLCWSDVMRGVLLEPEAVRRDLWLPDSAGSQD
jgi:hypothetical protein